MPPSPLLARLKTAILVTDGATGTMFYEKGVPPTQCYEELNLSHPDIVLDLHREYIQAGAQVIQTNTFGANASKLQDYGLAARVHEIALAGARLARQAAGRDVLVSGSLGPTRPPKDKNLSYTDEQYADMFREHARALYFGGVDFISLETFSTLQELKLAYRAAREAAPGLLIIPQLAFVDVAHTSKGDTLEDFLAAAAELGAEMLGVNCGMGPLHLIEIVKRLGERTELPIAAVPNAGYPEYFEGRIRYHTTPEYMADAALRLVQAGASMIGGCCGTTPAHIRAIAGAVKGLQPAVRVKRVPPAEPAPPALKPAPPPSTAKKWNVLAGWKQRLMWTVEVDPPTGLDTEKFFKGVEVFKACGVDGINIAENPLGRTRMSTTVLGGIIQEKYGVAAIVHIACRDRNVIGLQSELLGAGFLNIASILAITGDPTSAGDYPWATSVFDVNSFGLVDLLTKLNGGVNLAGHSIDRPTRFCIGVAFNAGKARIDHEIKRLEKKVAGGAQYAQTQPLYDKARILEVVERTRHLNIPVFIGILPVVSSKNAEFLHNEFPGIWIPDTVREALRRCNGDKLEEAKVSLDLMTTLMREVRGQVDGFYVIPQFNRFQMARQLIDQVKQG